MASANNSQHLSVSHRRSILLDEQQNGVVLSQIGPRCLSLSTTLTVLSMSTPPDHTSGKIRCSGVLCFVKDYSRRTFFIKIYDPEVKRLVWERNLAEVQSYNEVNPLYHLAQMKVGQAGFYFTNESEATHFAQVVKEKLSIRMQKQNTKQEGENVDCENQNNLSVTNSLYPSLNALDFELTQTSFVLVRSALEEAKHSLLENVYAAQQKEDSSNGKKSSSITIPSRKAPPPPLLINLDEQTDDAKLLNNHQNSVETKCSFDLSAKSDQESLPPTPPLRTSSQLTEKLYNVHENFSDKEKSYDNNESQVSPIQPSVDLDEVSLVNVFQSITFEKQEKNETVFQNDNACNKVETNVYRATQLTPIRKAPPVPAPRKCNKKMVN